MKNSSKHETSEAPNVMERLSEHPLFHWASQNITNIFLGIAIVLVLLFAIYKMSSRDKVQSSTDYFAAQKDFQLFSGQVEGNSDAAVREKALKQLEEILSNRPELNSKYDAPLAQALILDNKAVEAEAFAKRAFRRTEKNNLPQYTDLGEISLLAAKGNTKEALQRSIALKESLHNEAPAGIAKEHGDALIAYNLLQIAALQQQLGNVEGELEAWEAFKAFTLDSESGEAKTAGIQTSIMIQNIFAEGSTSLKNYIEKREKTLKREK